jgi:hypothetical protein
LLIGCRSLAGHTRENVVVQLADLLFAVQDRDLDRLANQPGN